MWQKAKPALPSFVSFSCCTTERCFPFIRSKETNQSGLQAVNFPHVASGSSNIPTSNSVKILCVFLIAKFYCQSCFPLFKKNNLFPCSHIHHVQFPGLSINSLTSFCIEHVILDFFHPSFYLLISCVSNARWKIKSGKKGEYSGISGSSFAPYPQIRVIW